MLQKYLYEDFVSPMVENIISNIELYEPYLNGYFHKTENNVFKVVRKNDNKIFVSIASYRDKQCPITIKDLISKADNPENLVIVICQQNNESVDINCYDTNTDSRGASIKLIRMDYRSARGPTYARYLIQQQWTGEQYYLQIDSHMRFTDGWDTKCKNELNKVISDVNHDRICLSNYPAPFNLDDDKISEDYSLKGHMYISEIDEDDAFPRFYSEYVKYLDKPQKSFGWAGGFSFSLSDIINQVPYEPYTPFIFFGEEMDILSRLISSEWQVYVPSIPICFTSFDREYRPVIWENPNSEMTNKLSKLRYYVKYDLVKDYLMDQIPHRLLIGLDDYKLKNNMDFIDIFNKLLNKSY
jgi:[Skp1-protein]-hydroxyproline N-acetylglucosaminyltransferase